MDKVKKVYFDPLLRSKDEIQNFLKAKPIGSAHPFQKELLVHDQSGGVTAIDISMHSEDFFLNAVSLSDLGEDVLGRLQLFPELLKFCNEYTVGQAPSSTFRVPIVNGEIHIFALSKVEPSYYDLCVGDVDLNTSCYAARLTFDGLEHSGDIQNHTGQLLHQ